MDLRSKLLLIVCGVGLVSLLTALFLNSMSAAQRDAEDQAALRLLGEFHRNYLVEHGQNMDEYVRALRAFQQEHQWMRSLRRYLDFVEQDAKKATQRPPDKTDHFHE